MSQTGSQTIAINVLLDISKTKRDETMKSGLLIKYKVRNIFLKNHAENEAGTRLLFAF